jgi:hypothetical protein
VTDHETRPARRRAATGPRTRPTTSHDIGAWLRRRNDEAKAEVLAITGELADIAEATIADALAVAHNASRSLARARVEASGAAVALVAEIERGAGLLQKVVAQARGRIEGVMPDGATRIGSLHDKDARPIAKGRQGLDEAITLRRSPRTVDLSVGELPLHPDDRHTESALGVRGGRPPSVTSPHRM